MRIKVSLDITESTEFAHVWRTDGIPSTAVNLMEGGQYVATLWIDDAKGSTWLRQLADAVDKAIADSRVNATTDAQAIAIVNEQPIPDALADAVGIEREPRQ